MDREKIIELLTWSILGLSIFFGILVFFPYIGYTIIIAGIVIPIYIIYNKHKKEKE